MRIDMMPGSTRHDTVGNILTTNTKQGSRGYNFGSLHLHFRDTRMAFQAIGIPTRLRWGFASILVVIPLV